MKNLNTIGVDLAKNCIQICLLSSNNKIRLNKALNRSRFALFIAQQPPSLFAFEACSSAHYWAQKAIRYGHEVKILPAQAIVPFRQGHKTDRNDALAIAETALRPKIKTAPIKNVTQQGLQATQRSREHLINERTALSNHLRGILAEFGFIFPKGFRHLRRHIPLILEDGDNDLPDFYRSTLHLLYRRFLSIDEDIRQLDRQVHDLAHQTEPCRRLLAIRGIGPIGALLLYATAGTTDAFSKGREFSAYIGLTPKQHSSGGKTTFTGISKRVANKRLRSILIQGALAVVRRIQRPKTPFEQWVFRLAQTKGYGKAAVALANKNARIAWSMLHNGSEYQCR